MTPLDPTATLEALRSSAVAFPVERDVVRASGPDAVSFLHGQLSQDVAGLAPGASAWSLLLHPQGKVVALVRLTRTGDDEVVLDTDGGWGDRLVAALERFKLRTKVDLEPLGWQAVAVRWPVLGGEPGDAGGGEPATWAPTGGLAVPSDWPGWSGVDLLGPSVEAPAGVAVGHQSAAEVARIAAGVPRLGAELTERTIPQEAGIVDRTVDFTKGCYVGQELVARIDSRGHVNRHLRGVRIASGTVEPGAELRAQRDGEPWTCGTVTSVAPAPAPSGGAVALAYVRREVTPPAMVEVAGGDGPVPAEVQTLPMDLP